MGTDIYLNWDGMSKEDKDSQITGWRINGRTGYLRASIGAHMENMVLRLVFPREFWYRESKEGQLEHDNGLEFDFIANQEKSLSILNEYLTAVKEGKEMKEHPLPEMAEMEDGIMKLLRQMGMVEVKSHGKTDLEFAASWVSEFGDFYQLGIQKQKEGKHPKVLISW